MDGEKKELIRKATEKIGKPDVIIELFTMHFVYASDKLSKLVNLKHEEIVDHRVTDVVIIDKAIIVNEISKVLSRSKSEVKCFKTKSGYDIEVKIKMASFTHNAEPYIAAHIISSNKRKSK